ncbi:MAG: BMP family ABC transporter substrate-binding protein [Actinomycetota bacterium]|nr:BMP family ABC transporter substrate-binding protein [Actinomycetota bacterium]
MGEKGIAPGAENGDDVANLVALTERQHELWALLRDEQDDVRRNQLFDELTTNRDELARLKDAVSARVDEPASTEPAPDSSEPEPPEEPSQGSLKDRIKDAEEAVRQASGDSPQPAPQPRSVGEDLRSRILTPPEPVAPATPPPPPPPIQPSPSPLPQPATPSPVVVPDAESSDRTSGLSPEAVPYLTREDDLAATRPQPPGPPPPAPAVPPESVIEYETNRPRPAQLAYKDLERVRPKHARPFPILAVVIAVAAVAAVAWILFFRSSDTVASPETAVTTTVAPVGVETGSDTVGQIRAVLDGLGLGAIAVEERNGTIYLSGIVASADDRAGAVGASQALAGDISVDASGITIGVTEEETRAAALAAIAAAGYDRINVVVSGGVATLTGVTPEDGSAGLIAAVDAVDGINQVVNLTETSDRSVALDTELKRITAVTPIVFASGQTSLNALHERVLDSVAEIIQAYSGPQITIVGYTDSTGSAEDNERISLLRGESVREYLIAQGIPTDRLAVDARGEASSSGSEAVAGLERRIEFEVGYSVAIGAGDGSFRIGIVAPSASNDLAFTQSIVDAVAVVAAERGGVAVDITDGTFVPDDAAAALRAYAADGYDLVIAHGSQYGTALVDIAKDFPDTAFAWGTAADTFGLPNVSSYEVASDQGGFVMGVISGLLTGSDVVGVVGPLEVGDAQLFVNGYRAGVLSAKPGATVPVTYTGSFSDVALAAEAATAHIGAGADVLTGTAQMVVGAVGVAIENNALWFGTQANQTELAPDLVVASQVYHWEVVLRQIISGIEQGTLGGEAYSIDLENGGIIIEYNPGFDLPTAVQAAADDTIAGIISGTITTGF